jgi:hypothetical protein
MDKMLRQMAIEENRKSNGKTTIKRIQQSMRKQVLLQAKGNYALYTTLCITSNKSSMNEDQYQSYN